MLDLSELIAWFSVSFASLFQISWTGSVVCPLPNMALPMALRYLLYPMKKVYVSFILNKSQQPKRVLDDNFSLKFTIQRMQSQEQQMSNVYN